MHLFCSGLVLCIDDTHLEGNFFISKYHMTFPVDGRILNSAAMSRDISTLFFAFWSQHHSDRSKIRQWLQVTVTEHAKKFCVYIH